MKGYRKNFKAYLDDLGRRAPSPGGGSAICLVFCMGSSLIEKAINYSLLVKLKGRKEKERNRKLKDTALKIVKLRTKIYPYIDRDSYLFEKIMSTKGKKRRQFIIQSEKIIVDLGRVASEVFFLAKEIESGIKKSMISDFYIGLDFIKSTLFGCILNLEANNIIFGTKSRFIGIFKKIYKKSLRLKL